ncbi:MAG TPA: hypothetical protein VM103_02800 [Candidatus Paceibacterota bacterium]|nr:hypothetical protein [Candidatus Paceibacterota bacterium]
MRIIRTIFAFAVLVGYVVSMLLLKMIQEGELCDPPTSFPSWTPYAASIIPLYLVCFGAYSVIVPRTVHDTKPRDTSPQREGMKYGVAK